MGAGSQKIINDPVYGFITIDSPLILELIRHPFFQRLRRIQQMGFAHLVYPGAVHTRLHHALGAYHLMGNALNTLKTKGIEISESESLGARAAILLHDAGHSPFSHSLENKLIDIQHETVSLQIMQQLNKELDGQLTTAINIFTDRYPKRFLHQLVSGQLDVDRMDYLNRDSFFTGVSEGVIGYDRILHMLTVHHGELMVQEKGIYSIEKFLVARRLMYWQVYLHKTVVSAESMLVKIIQRAKERIAFGEHLYSGSSALDYFLSHSPKDPLEYLELFGLLDDYDVMGALKLWMNHEDKVLSILSSMLINRRLLKVRLQAEPFDEKMLEFHRAHAMRTLNLNAGEAAYFVFNGEHANTTYNPEDEKINILFKDNSIRDISQVDNALISRSLATAVKKFYICYVA
ncbi:MAG: HD domain-containing protein [Bacteroidota bacterium]|nr:HD domain-containing protein [Bacteroidota bacterium]MDP4211153.1 HD domain-containing protein [Bacteroidota bacterium]MDP4249448.1 HD domain-containing protein [Bacteroidota bacterium]